MQTIPAMLPNSHSETPVWATVATSMLFGSLSSQGPCKLLECLESALGFAAPSGLSVG